MAEEVRGATKEDGCQDPSPRKEECDANCDHEHGPDSDHRSAMSDISKAVQALALHDAQSGASAPRTLQDAQRRKYKFWDTQPVPKISEEVTTNEPIEEDKPPEEIRKEPYSLPAGFEWDTVDLGDDENLKELYTLLNENYVEDEDNMFRFDYSPQFLRWALQPPGWLSQWHCGVRVTKNKKLVCFISAVPANLKIYEKHKKLVEINFLCVHKKLRAKRVAPVLIREITRRVHEQGLFQAVYTGGVILPKPVSTCRYWHRSLNPKKLVECRFSQLSKNMTMARTIKLYRLPDKPQTVGFRELRPDDVPQAHDLLQRYLNTFDLAATFTEDEFRHWFLPREGIVNSFVVENDGEISDMCSFYTLPSSVINHEVYKTLKAAYSFYNVAGKTPWPILMKDALIAAKNMGFDVFNALDLMDNKKFLGELKFGVGDGNLHYYLYNWRCPDMEPRRLGLVLQ